MAVIERSGNSSNLPTVSGTTNKAKEGKGDASQPQGSANAMILELVLPFLSLEELFEGGICLLNKGIRGKCLYQLHQQCKKMHPVLLMSSSSKSSCNKDQDDSGGSAVLPPSVSSRLLTYGRYRRFLLSEAESRGSVALDLQKLSGLEVLMEIRHAKTNDILCLGAEELVYRPDTSGNTLRDCFLGCHFSTENFTLEDDSDWDELDGTDLMRVRFVLRRIATGEMVTLIDRADPAQFVSQATGYSFMKEGAYELPYLSQEVLFNVDPRLLVIADLRFVRQQGASGEGGTSKFRYSTSSFEDGASVKFYFQLSEQSPEDNLAHSVVGAMDQWKWY